MNESPCLGVKVKATAFPLSGLISASLTGRRFHVEPFRPLYGAVLDEQIEKQGARHVILAHELSATHPGEFNRGNALGAERGHNDGQVTRLGLTHKGVPNHVDPLIWSHQCQPHWQTPTLPSVDVSTFQTVATDSTVIGDPCS